jgi:hypothetical protein
LKNIALTLLITLLCACTTAPPAKHMPIASKVLVLGDDGDTPPDLAALLELLRAPQGTGDWKKFDSINEAGIWAIKRASECSLYYECGGTILKDPAGKFVVSPVGTDYQGDHVSFSTEAPTGWTTVATYHTHPCIPDHATNLFSPEDMMGIVVRKIPAAFMGDLCTGDVHKYSLGDPQNDTKYDIVWLTPGKIVGHFDVAKPPPAKVGI